MIIQVLWAALVPAEAGWGDKELVAWLRPRIRHWLPACGQPVGAMDPLTLRRRAATAARVMLAHAVALEARAEAELPAAREWEVGTTPLSEHAASHPVWVVTPEPEEAPSAQEPALQPAPAPPTQRNLAPPQQSKSRNRTAQFRRVSEFERGKQRRAEEERQRSTTLGGTRGPSGGDTQWHSAVGLSPADREMRAARESAREKGAVLRLEKLIRMAVRAGVIDEAEAERSRRSVADGFATAVSCAALWEDQLTRAGVLDNR